MTARATGTAAPLFLSDEQGAALIEYTILLSFVAAVGIAVVWPVAMKVQSQFAALRTALNYTPNTAAPDHDTKHALTHQTTIGSIHNDHALLSPNTGTTTGTPTGNPVGSTPVPDSSVSGGTGNGGSAPLPQTSTSASFHNCGSGFWNANAGKCVGRHH